MSIDEFRIHVPDDVLDDLRDRLGRTRYLTAPGRSGWEGGLGGEQLRALVDGWLAVDWRAEEARLNAVEQGIAHVQGCRIHFARVRGRGESRTAEGRRKPNSARATGTARRAACRYPRIPPAHLDRRNPKSTSPSVPRAN